MISSQRARYLGAIASVLPSVTLVACSKDAPPPTTTTGSATAAVTAPASASAPATATAPATASGSATATAPALPPSGLVGLGHPNFPSCPSGAFCVSEQAKLDAKQAAPAPFAKCAATAKQAGGVGPDVTGNFNAENTKTERAKTANACCYTWVIPCPGGRLLRDATGAPAVARVTTRRDWLLEAASAVSTAHLDDAARAAQAAYWTQEAAFEHASIASFAQLTLDLMAFGAPPDLLADAQRAALDEIEHARITFALATAYGGEALGPSALAARPGSCRTLADLARTTFVDACVGESVASAQLAERARETADPVLSRLLATMGEDEERHAELAWRIVAWTLRSGDPAVASALAAVRDDVVDELVSLTHATAAASAIDELRAMVLREIVLPCAIALLDAHEEAVSRVSESLRA